MSRPKTPLNTPYHSPSLPASQLAITLSKGDPLPRGRYINAWKVEAAGYKEGEKPQNLIQLIYEP